MKNVFNPLLFCLLLPFVVQQVNYAQVSTTPITSLSDSVLESSGLIWIENRLITHNDSGDGPHLYELDTLSGDVTRTVTVINASAVDWEDITADDTYLYIGDFGNNNGDRTDLAIFRVSILDFLTTPNDTVTADTLLFNYADQLDFTPTTYETPYDAEALMACGDSLYIFTKDWSTSSSTVYSLPKVPGNYSLTPTISFDTEGLVCGGTYDPIKNRFVLVGYAFTTPFVYVIENITDYSFAEVVTFRNNLALSGSSQCESICIRPDGMFYTSTEEHFTGAATLHRMQVDYTLNADFMPFNTAPLIYPNPVVNKLYHTSDKAELYTITGQLLATSYNGVFDLSHVLPGCYLVKLHTTENTLPLVQRIYKK